jgi:hypothetical protein
MNILERSLLVAAVFLAGCGTARDVAMTPYYITRGAAVGSYKVARAVAVGSYRVASAPVRYATRKSRNEPRMVGSPEATESDVTERGRYSPAPDVAQAPPRSPRSERESNQSASSTAQRTTRKKATQSTSVSSSRGSAPSAEFPTAKSVPGKPDYVFSPFDASGRYVDVSGYAPGTKVKDPWTDKVFIVP